MDFSTWALAYLKSHKDSEVCKYLHGDLDTILSTLELMEAAWDAAVLNTDGGVLADKYTKSLEAIINQ